MKITIVGGSNIDLYGRQHDDANDNAALMPHGDSIPGSFTCHPGGVARNIAENLGLILAAEQNSSMHNVSLITALGDDHFAAMIRTQLRNAGVDISHAVTTPEATSDMYMAIYNAAGQLTNAVNDMRLIEQLSADDIIPALAGHHAEDIVMFDGNLNEHLIAALVQETAEAALWVDGVSAHKVIKIKPYLAHISMLKCNRLEATALTGLPYEMLPFDHAKALRDCGVDKVVITDGGDGFLIGSDDGYEAIAVDKPQSIHTVSGAGDALMAGLIYGAAKGLDMMTSAQFAHKVAAITLMHDGPVHPEIGRLAHQDG